MTSAKYRRLLLKASGEMLAGEQGYGIQPSILQGLVHTPEGIRALSKDKPIAPQGVERYLKGKFGEGFDAAREAMAELAESSPPSEIAECAYDQYVKFRPNVPAGVKGWGAAGVLDVEEIGKLQR